MSARPLSETDLYVLFQEQEDVFLFDKDLNKEIWRTHLYGNATSGLIDLSNEWAMACGEKLILWKNNKLKTIEDKELAWIHDVRQVAKNEVEILTDPWREGSAVWLYSVMTEDKTKIRDFPDYYNSKEYTDDVRW
jgi:hypothetical protein